MTGDGQSGACVECVRYGCPTEGMTLVCHHCHDLICIGHTLAHAKRTGHHPCVADTLDQARSKYRQEAQDA